MSFVLVLFFAASFVNYNPVLAATVTSDYPVTFSSEIYPSDDTYPPSFLELFFLSENSTISAFSGLPIEIGQIGITDSDTETNQLGDTEIQTATLIFDQNGSGWDTELTSFEEFTITRTVDGLATVIKIQVCHCGNEHILIHTPPEAGQFGFTTTEHETHTFLETEHATQTIVETGQCSHQAESETRTPPEPGQFGFTGSEDLTPSVLETNHCECESETETRPENGQFGFTGTEDTTSPNIPGHVTSSEIIVTRTVPEPGQFGFTSTEETVPSQTFTETIILQSSEHEQTIPTQTEAPETVTTQTESVIFSLTHIECVTDCTESLPEISPIGFTVTETDVCDCEDETASHTIPENGQFGFTDTPIESHFQTIWLSSSHEIIEETTNTEVTKVHVCTPTSRNIPPNGLFAFTGEETETSASTSIPTEIQTSEQIQILTKVHTSEELQILTHGIPSNGLFAFTGEETTTFTEGTTAVTSVTNPPVISTSAIESHSSSSITAVPSLQAFSKGSRKEQNGLWLVVRLAILYFVTSILTYQL